MPSAEGAPDPALLAALGAVLPQGRILARPIDRVARASDASFYRMIPQVVVEPQTPEEVAGIFQVARRVGIPLTFRAGGTSLSGQSVTRGILVCLSGAWRGITPEGDGAIVRVGPGAIGGQVNAALAPLGRRIGPDPASIDAAMMGGILANNASGMCCGVVENAYHTLESIRFVLPSGLALDSAAPDYEDALREGAPALAEGLKALRARILADPALTERIRGAYRIKNTTGYGLNAFLDHARPGDILAHLLIGSEGTLAFIAEARLRTLPTAPHRGTCLALYGSLEGAIAAVAGWRDAGARAVEFLDTTSLEASAGAPGLPPGLPPGACALLTEMHGQSEAELEDALRAAAPLLQTRALIEAARFTRDARTRGALWKIRKGLFPAVGARKASGHTVVIEDVAFPGPALAPAIADLKTLLEERGYGAAVLFGHAKDGNLHFVFDQSFRTSEDIRRYQVFMGALSGLVLGHGGTLKAEHGTGRNMAPFVEAQWGAQAFGIMEELKALFDPGGILNPGVILNPDPLAHVRDLKPLPSIDPEVDRCIECGFCEPVCPSRRLTLTPRQRIVLRREVARLEATGEDARALASLRADFPYAALDTCAADGLCAQACPVDINTGALVKRLRAEATPAPVQGLGAFVARRFRWAEALGRGAVWAGGWTAGILGEGRLNALLRGLGRGLGVRLPQWTGAIGRPPARALPRPSGLPVEVVFFPSCPGRMLGAEAGAPSDAERFVEVLAKAGLGARLPAGARGLCCGLAFGSKGLKGGQAVAAEALVDALWEASEGGRLPCVVDASSCAHGVLGAGDALSPEGARRLAALDLRDGATYLSDLGARLPLRRVKGRVVLHPTCATRHLGGVDAMVALAQRCAETVIIPRGAGCCGMAGDRGLTHPELSRAALEEEGEGVRAAEGEGHYASSTLCEVALTKETGRPYGSILRLVWEASRAAGASDLKGS